jgi:hypothetical protein
LSGCARTRTRLEQRADRLVHAGDEQLLQRQRLQVRSVCRADGARRNGVAQRRGRGGSLALWTEMGVTQGEARTSARLSARRAGARGRGGDGRALRKSATHDCATKKPRLKCGDVNERRDEAGRQRRRRHWAAERAGRLRRCQ